ncbi:aldo/keto reductase [Phycicoccus avicenniae]|uniref:aldo/keto reductase n=1 Tax=Phycicoccus avicenniae TaxID=2828860 RepID=UPI003D2AAFF6
MSDDGGSREPLRLNDGHHLPAIGLGTFGLTGEAGIAAIVSALGLGYRLLDTAVGYGNEWEVGEAVRRSEVPGEDVVVATKIRARDHGYDATRRSIAESRRTLGVDRIGLHLIHWPNPRLDRYVETWQALVAARDEGEVRSIGVSNFTAAHLETLVGETGVVPAVNQVELHPHLPQAAQRAVHERLGIRTQSWSPLGRGRVLLERPEVTRPAERLSASPAQVVLRWHHQLGADPVPKSADPGRQRENLAPVGRLTEAEMDAITGLGRRGGRLWGGDPETTHL